MITETSISKTIKLLELKKESLTKEIDYLHKQQREFQRLCQDIRNYQQFLTVERQIKDAGKLILFHKNALKKIEQKLLHEKEFLITFTKTKNDG